MWNKASVLVILLILWYETECINDWLLRACNEKKKKVYHICGSPVGKVYSYIGSLCNSNFYMIVGNRKVQNRIE